MSALAEALVAAQRRALQAVEKQYVAGKLDHDGACTCLNLIGLNDEVDQDRLFSALDMIRDYGAPLPTEPRPANSEPKKPEPASDAQLAYIARLVKDKVAVAPDLPVTKAQAHEIIDTLQTDTYDAAKWTIPF
jgi:hypothetical protein